MAELNLIPYGFRKNKNRLLGSGGGIIILALVAILVIGAVAFPIILKEGLKSEERKLRDEVQKGAAILKESEDLRKSIDSYNQHINMVTSITKVAPRVEPRVRGLQQHVVGDISFENLTVGLDGQIMIQASAKDLNSIAIFGANLQESKEYSGARITNVSFIKEKGNYTFSITIPY